MAAINELDAFCIALPPDVCPTCDPGNPRFMPVVLDEFVGHHTLGRHVPAQPGWSVIGQICHDRARLTVDRQLVVDGQPVTPEAYLKRWRTRLAKPVPVSRLGVDKGLQVVAVFRWRHSPELAARKAGWINPPYPTFGDLLADQGFGTDVLSGPPVLPGPPITTLLVDLSAKDGARTAWWADDFLACTSIQGQVICRRVEFRKLPCDAQNPVPGLHLAKSVPDAVFASF